MYFCKLFLFVYNLCIMKKYSLFTSVIIMILFTNLTFASNMFNDENLNAITQTLKTKSTLPETLIQRGVRQAATFWEPQDGTLKDFENFCTRYFCHTLEEKTTLFYRICDNFEIILGHNNRVSIELQRPEQVTGYTHTTVDGLFSAYDGNAHLYEDMFQNKLAFVIILNFPSFTLQEKINNGDHWSDLEWGFVRLGDMFTSRVPAKIQQNIAKITAEANQYVDNYNIDMEQVGSYHNERFWNTPTPLITHWGLRDELKSAYEDKQNGLAKQIVLYDVMKRIINQEVPLDVIKQDKNYVWYPSTNQLMLSNIEILNEPLEKKSRYGYLLEFFHAEQAADDYYKNYANFIERKFEGEYEISVKEIEKLFVQLLGSEQVKQTAQLIKKRLGRKLYPFDIWYDGFKERSQVDQAYLDSVVKNKYPNIDAFACNLPNLLQQLGFDASTIDTICRYVTVDASIGAGHAWESLMRCDNSMLRTRCGTDGMDYKGYNIGIHEFGHNVEQTISLHNVPNYFLHGVPNTAFTEALAFVFQARDLDLLGIPTTQAETNYLNTLDVFWNCYEIMGVSLVDIRIWQWMYKNPDANAEQLKEAVLSISKEVWNEYYAPIFKVKDQTILSVYSHILVDPLYVSAYPLGYLINFQLENHFKDKNLGSEVKRIYKLGRLTPDLWMQRAVGQSISVQPLLEATNLAIKEVDRKSK